MKAFVSVIIPAYNEEKYIGDCLAALDAQNYPKNKYEIIVVDNDSEDKTCETAKSYNVKLLQKQQGNVGKIRNLGTMEASGDVLAFIDSDCVVDSNWLQSVNKLTENATNAVFGGGCFLPNHPSPIEKYWLLGSDESRLPNDLIGASTVVTKANFEKIGGFNEEVTSGEDTQFSKEAHNQGLSIRIVKELSVIHLGNAKTVKDFFRRQAWHGENYITDIRNSFRDPTFFVVCFSSASFLSSFIGAITFSKELFLWSVIAFLVTPTILSLKRILRSNIFPSIKSLIFIYGLDFLYIQARSYSLGKALCRKLIELKSQKVA